jgi:calcium release-activated calcium channel protein 1
MGSSAMDAMQVLFTAFDTGMSSKWREEDRSWRDEDRTWRREDLDYRREERGWREQEKDMRDTELRWREEDVEQRHVDNARYLWTRFVEKNRRDVEEKSEQLKAVSSLAALFAGFAVVTLTQFGFDADTVGIAWIAFYGILTALVVGLMTISMVTCTLILGSILKNGKLYVNEEAEEDFMFRCKAFIRNHKETPALKPPCPRRTFEAFWRIRCETDWRRSFQLFALGVLSFLVSLVPIGWIKFSYSPVTAGLFISIIGISIVGWGCVQYSWGTHMTSNIRNLEDHETRVHPVGLPFDWHLSPVQQTTL